MEPADSLYPIPRYNGPVNWRARFLAVPLLAMVVAGCAFFFLFCMQSP